jgi:PKD repeat protein
MASLFIGAAGLSLVRPHFAAAATIVEARVNTSTDDAEQFATGGMYLTSSDLELIHDADDQTVGIRWTNLAIPRNATITTAYIQFVAKESQSEATSLTFRAQASDNPPTFTGTDLNVTSRTRTAASMSWSPVPWTVGDAGGNQRTPDFSAVVQEVVNRSGWSSGNALVMIVNGIGHRTAWAYDGSPTEAPLLHVEYSLGTSGDLAPVAALWVSVAPSPALTVIADGSGSSDTDTTPIASYRFDFGDGTPPVVTNAPTATAQHTYSVAGTYTVSLIATDTAGNASTAVTSSVTVNVAASGTVNRRVAASTDDAEENTSGSVNLTSVDLELIHDSTDQTVGMRWTSVSVPKDALITRAYIQFRAKESQSEATTLRIAGQASDNASTFSSSAFSGRSRTSIAGTWSPAAWTAGDATGAQRTPDISGVIQEIVNRAGWASGNALAIIITGSGHRTAYSFDGSASDAPLLHVEYGGTPAADQAPIAKLTVTPNGSPSLNVTASGSGSTDSDPFPIKSYRFDFGDGTSAVTTNAPTSSTTHTYAAAGTYTVSLKCTDTAGLQSTSVTKSVTVSAASQIAVYAGYYDTHHTDQPKSKPSPWIGSSNTIFVGTADPGTGLWDTSAIRIDNTSGGSLSNVAITVDMGTHHFALWSGYTVPAGQRIIFAQTDIENFDGSDTNAAGCYSCSPLDCGTKVSSAVPVVHVTVGSKTVDYVDPGQILNTHGVDEAGCPYTGTRNEESSNWVQIFPRVTLAPGIPNAFTAPTSSGTVADARPALWMTLGPNPAHGALRVAFRTSSFGTVRLDVMDVAGRVIRRGTDELLEAGECNRRLDLSGTAPGVYFARLTTVDGMRQQPVVLTP